MRKQRIEYDSPVDALVAVAKRLGEFENKYKMISEDFFDNFCKGKTDDSADFVSWSNDYQHYMTIRFDLERQLKNAA